MYGDSRIFAEEAAEVRNLHMPPGVEVCNGVTFVSIMFFSIVPHSIFYHDDICWISNVLPGIGDWSVQRLDAPYPIPEDVPRFYR